jgi:hypothetical protein
LTVSKGIKNTVVTDRITCTYYIIPNDILLVFYNTFAKIDQLARASVGS